MKVTNTYFKSLSGMENGLGTKIYVPTTQERIPYQTLENMLKNGNIKPNTVHDGFPQRLCASYLTDKFAGSYRPEGILFKTEDRPAFCTPVDLMALTTGESFTSADYYSDLIGNFGSLIYDSVDEMLKDNPTGELALKKLNTLRRKAGLAEIVDPFDYNECCFESQVSIGPVGLVGTSREIVEIAKKFHLPIYPTTQDYVALHAEGNWEISLGDFFRKSSVGALYRVGASFTLDALAIGMATGDIQSFCEDLDPAKLLRVTAFVVGINFVDYKFNVTNRLDNFTKRLSKK